MSSRPHSVLTAVCACALTLAAAFGAAPPAAAVAIHDFTAVQADMQSLVGRFGLEGASLRVSRQGNVLYRQTFGAYTPQTRLRIASASKWLSALAIARLVDRGQMRWTDTVGQYLPNAPVDKREITLEQLFSHTSALPYGEDLCLSNPLFTLASCANRILQQPLIGTPGRVFAYGGNSMQVAGRLAELATGKAWDDIFIDEVVTPLGMSATDYATSSTAPGYVRNGNPRIGGGVRSTLEDYGRAMDMVLADGCLDGGFPQQCAADRRYLTSATLAGMARDRTVGTVVISTPDTGIGYGYGFGFWIEPPYAPGALPVLLSPGAFGFTPWVDRSANLAGVFLVDDLNGRLADHVAALRARVRQVTAEGTGVRIKAGASRPSPVAAPTAALRSPIAPATTAAPRPKTPGPSARPAAQPPVRR